MARIECRAMKTSNAKCFEFNPYSLKVNDEKADTYHDLPTEEILAMLDEVDEYRSFLKEQTQKYDKVAEYFKDGQYAEFDLEKCVKEYCGSEITRSYEPEYYDDLAGPDGKPMLYHCVEIMDMKLGQEAISIVYEYTFASVDEDQWTVTVNGKKPNYDEEVSTRFSIREEDLPREVKIGERAWVNRDYFNYILDFILENNQT